MNTTDKAYNAYREALQGISITKNEKIVLELKSAYYSFLFARYIEKSNIEEHFKVIVNSGDKYWLNIFIEEVNYKNTRVEEWLLYI